MDLTGYEHLRSPIVSELLTRDMERKDARTVHKHTVANIPVRLRQLRQICEQNGLSNDPAGWTELLSNAERDEVNIGSATPIWEAVVYDVSLAVGELLIARSDGVLHWSMYTGSTKSLAFQHTVLVGFQNVVAKGYYVDIFWAMKGKIRRHVPNTSFESISDYMDYIAQEI